MPKDPAASRPRPRPSPARARAASPPRGRCPRPASHRPAASVAAPAPGRFREDRRFPRLLRPPATEALPSRRGRHPPCPRRPTSGSRARRSGPAPAPRSRLARRRRGARDPAAAGRPERGRRNAHRPTGAAWHTTLSFQAKPYATCSSLQMSPSVGWPAGNTSIWALSISAENVRSHRPPRSS